MGRTEKLNMQMLDETEGRKSLQELNLLDDFLFDVATEDLEACQIMIELSLGIRLKSIRWKEGQKVVHNLPGKRGIRMDFCVEDGEGNFFDLEMQKQNRGNIPKRTRFYQALTDAPFLKSGEVGFDNMKPAYLVIICGFDLFDLGKYRYTFGNYCEEVPGLCLGDGCKKIILNTKGRNDREVEKTLTDFLHYVEKSEETVLPADCDERLKHLHKKIVNIKSSEEMEVTYMKMEERDRLIREEGEHKGREEGKAEELIRIVCKLLKKNRTPEEIAELLDETEEKISAICQAAKLCGPNYACSEICAVLAKEQGSEI